MIITKQLEWMRSYIENVAHIVPSVQYIRRISTKRANEDRTQHIHGLMTYVNKRDFRICLYVTYKSRIDDTIKEYTTIELLHTLAHELAHLNTPIHSAERMNLECSIMAVFMSHLSRDGYISEEEEIKNGLFYEREEE